MVYLVPTPIGNIADISLRALQTLESCDEILCEDTRIAKKLIALLNARGLLKKADFNYTSFHSHNEIARLAQFGTDFFAKNVAFLSDAGMPCISDPGAKLVAFLQKNDIAYSAVSGACSVVLAYALSGFEGGFSFLGFAPHKLNEKRVFLQNALQSPLHCVIFESPKRVLDSLKLLCESAPNRAIFIAKELTKMHEKFYFGEIGAVYEKLQGENLNGEWVLVVQGAENLSNSKESRGLNKIDIKNLDIPPKIKAKLLAKIDGRSVKECYDEILNAKK
ncbi:16S rRNA (cytidine(1402)-2'-O)-methyltransferase [Helicobacter sp. 23-1045]